MLLQLPKYDPLLPSASNSRLGLHWQAPFVQPPPVAPPLAPPRSYPDRAHFVVCDHHCVRRCYPVVRVAVRNPTADPVRVGTKEVRAASVLPCRGQVQTL